MDLFHGTTLHQTLAQLNFGVTIPKHVCVMMPRCTVFPLFAIDRCIVEISCCVGRASDLTLWLNHCQKDFPSCFTTFQV